MQKEVKLLRDLLQLLLLLLLTERPFVGHSFAPGRAGPAWRCAISKPEAALKDMGRR